MKKVISISIITCLLFFSCETSKQETANQDVSNTDQIETISQEESSEDNTTLESENNQEEIAFEEKIEEDKPAYFEEPVSEEEIAADISESNEEKVSDDALNEAQSENETEQIENAQNETTQNKTENTVTAQNNTAAKETVNTNTKPQQNKTAETMAQTNSTNSNNKTNTNTKQPSVAAATAAVLPAENKSSEQKTLQQELSEASDSINNEKEEKQPVPSRNMDVKNRQFIDVTYPGTGWVYLGEVEKQNLFVFFGRKIENNDTIFTLQSKKPGNATLHFYKNDPLSQQYIDDYMKVSVSEEIASDNTHEKAPEYALAVPPKPEKILPQTAAENSSDEIPSEKTASSSNKPARTNTAVSSEPNDGDLTKVQTRISKGDSTDETIPDFSSHSVDSQNMSSGNSESNEQTESSDHIAVNGDLLEAAQKAYDAKKYEEALSLVKDFFLTTSNRIDEGLYLEAQIYEAKSPVRNIKNAISDYDTIVKKWPASKFWKKANERSIYLKRFYIDIR